MTIPFRELEYTPELHAAFQERDRDRFRIAIEVKRRMKALESKQEYRLNEFAYSGAVLDIPEEVFQ